MYKEILLIDDNPDDQEHFVELVKDIDPAIKITLAKNGLNAMEVLLIAKSLPQLIFLDINMPGIGGYDFLHALRTNEMYAAYKHIPVIVLTGSMRDEEKFRKLGALISITKPFSGKVYRDILRTVLQHDVVKDADQLREAIARQTKV